MKNFLLLAALMLMSVSCSSSSASSEAQAPTQDVVEEKIIARVALTGKCDEQLQLITEDGVYYSYYVYGKNRLCLAQVGDTLIIKNGEPAGIKFVMSAE